MLLYKKIFVFIFMFLSFYCVQSFAAYEQKLTFSLKALFKDRAMIDINGTQYLLSVGEQSPEGVKLLSSDAQEANIYCHGKEYTLYINQKAYQSVYVEGENKDFDIPKKLVPGSTVPFIKSSENNITKYVLKTEYNYPSVMKYGQGAIWIASGKKLLRFDIEKEAWGEFDLSNTVLDDIRELSVSDKSVILTASVLKNNKKNSGLFQLDKRTSRINQKLDMVPRSYQLIGEALWFLTYNKGLGRVSLKNNNSSIDGNKALLNKDSVQGNGNILAANGHDIWYSFYSKYHIDNKTRRLNEVCVAHYNKKKRTYKKYTRKEMGLEAESNCYHLAVSDDAVWLSHGNSNSGLSVFNIATKRWKHISASANHMLIGGQQLMVDSDHVWILGRNQLIGLNAKTMHADVVLGDAVVKHSWRSVFYVKNGYAWFSAIESDNEKISQPKFTLYKVPVNPDTKKVDDRILN